MSKKKVQLKVNEEDRQLWMILDDNRVLFTGPGVEMVQGFCFMAGLDTYKATPKQQEKFKAEWEGTLRLVRQQSCFVDVKHSKNNRKLAKAAAAFDVDEEDFFD